MLVILEAIFRLVGWVSLADKLLARIAAKHKAQEIADVPQTKNEEADYFK